MEIHIEKKLLHFKKPSGTSRGMLYDKPSWILRASLPNGNIAQGECSVIPGLSPDFIDDVHYENDLMRLRSYVQSNWSLEEMDGSHVFQSDKWLQLLREFQKSPSLIFGIETLVRDLLGGGSGLLFDSPFSRKEKSIPINGLIWMGDESFMLAQMEEKLAEGFSTIKMKVGALDWEKEKALLVQLRNRFSVDELTLRVDANGAFTPQTVFPKLQQLSDLDIHSIEQPIQAGQPLEMKKLCRETPVGIALDEELIGMHQIREKQELLETIQPQFIVLKPSLHGGFHGCHEWIELANERNIQWWMTSALESSIGLNAIAQFTATYENNLPQGLGTGSLYTNNFDSSLVVESGQLRLT
ncbi:MAG: o-succinylbenzoate synthase [Crocinitomicaceae bacterium]